MFENLENILNPNGLESIQPKEKTEENPFKLPDIKDLPIIDEDEGKFSSLSLPDIKDLPIIPITDETPIIEKGDGIALLAIDEKTEQARNSENGTSIKSPNSELNIEPVFIKQDRDQIIPEELLKKNNIESESKQPTEQENNSNSAENNLPEQTTENLEETTKIPCRNEYLSGQEHPVTGVPFQEKTVVNADGEKVVGVFPIFDSICDVQLPEDMSQASDKEQFAECNAQLKEKVKNDPELRSKFTEEQLEQIENGDTPDGYTWHHNEETGKMQLVDSETHAKTGHTGGKSIWGGGSENR